MEVWFRFRISDTVTHCMKKNFLDRNSPHLDWIYYEVNLRIQLECRKIWSRKISKFWPFSQSHRDLVNFIHPWIPKTVLPDTPLLLELLSHWFPRQPVSNVWVLQQLGTKVTSRVLLKVCFVKKRAMKVSQHYDPKYSKDPADNINSYLESSKKLKYDNRSNLIIVFINLNSLHNHCVKCVLRISPYSVQMWENTDQKKLSIWTRLHITKEFIWGVFVFCLLFMYSVLM